ncbi:MAG: hypothetical protein HFE98_08245 [Ruminiclostridium sp.]|jgi:hypothetical protein|nr:hypothetical protein [Ruminiclostridium sp.]MCI9466553.1 hypothetical protein [Ruminiclostridium sp.]
MGQTDAQFKAFIRFILQDIQDAMAEQDAEKVKELLKKMEDKLQKTLED